MEGYTLPEFCRKLGKSRGWGERVIWEYRDELPHPSRVGIVRVWPVAILEKLQAIICREERCATGGAR